MGQPRRAAFPVLVVAVFATSLLGGCFGSGPGLFYDHGRNGHWGKEFLSSSKYTHLRVEIDYENGAPPETSTVNALRSTLEKYLNKPRGIEIQQSADVQGQGKANKYTFNEIRDLEDGARDHYKGGDDAVLYILFIDGGSSQDQSDSRVLGAAYSGSSIVMFKDNIRSAATNCGTPFGVACPRLADVERAVMIHELGHILGLVNNGIEMVDPHEDANHEGHSTNPESVMYWKVETGDIIDLFLGKGIPSEFDANDEADLCNAGGKCP